VTNADTQIVSILLNTTTAGATTPTFATNVNFSTGVQPLFVQSKDFNGDNLPDLAVVNTSSNSISILLNTTTAAATSVTFAPRVDFPTGSVPYSASVGDFNGDSKFDLAVSNRNDNSVSILLNTTTAAATTPTFASKVDFATGSGPLAVSTADLNGDAKPDLAVANTFATPPPSCSTIPPQERPPLISPPKLPSLLALALLRQHRRHQRRRKT
jgi:hypothetical protein